MLRAVYKFGLVAMLGFKILDSIGSNRFMVHVAPAMNPGTSECKKTSLCLVPQANGKGALAAR